MATFGEFSVAYLGMVASQLGLNVTGQNISNINTPGYTRQQLDQYSFVANGSGLYRPTSPAAVGQGALVSGVSQLRDPYLDIRFRKEMSGVASADATLGGLEQILSVIDDVEKAGGVTPALQALRDAFANLSSDKVNEKEFDTLVRSAAQELCQILNLNASKLEEAYDNVMSSYKEDIKGVNQTLQQIQELTEKIRVADINGDQALELRDSRNQLIDELSQYMKIDVTYGTEQIAPGFEVEKITIRMVNNDTGKPDKTLIDGISRAEITLDDNLTANPGLLLGVGELFDTKGNQTSNTNSSYKVSGLTFGENAQNGPSTIKISYIDENGVSQTATVNFTLSVPADSTDETQVTQAKADTLNSILDGLKNATLAGGHTADLTGIFDVTATSSGLTFKSNKTGDAAATITGIDTTGSNISFGSAQKTDAVKSNQGVIKEGMGFGALESTRQILTGAGEFSDNGTVTGTRGIPYYMKSLDMLANKLATTLNSINTVDKDGNKLQSIDAATGLPIDNPKAGNLFVAEIGNGVQNENATITAANIAISNAWASGDVQVVAAINTDPNASTQNDNLSRFINAFTEQYSYNPLEISRQDGTTYQSGEIQQTVGANQAAEVEITYLDGMNQKHTVTVEFVTGNNATDTRDAMYAAIEAAIADQNNPLHTAGLEVNATNTGLSTVGNGDNLGGLVLNMEILDPNTGESMTGLNFTEPSGGYVDANNNAINNGNIYTGSFEGCYANTEAILGTAYSTTSTVYETYATSADTLNNSRDGVMGVDLNEEGINLMTYQRAFAAACRLMTTLDEAMNTVINGMGVVGR